MCKKSKLSPEDPKFFCNDYVQAKHRDCFGRWFICHYLLHNSHYCRSVGLPVGRSAGRSVDRSVFMKPLCFLQKPPVNAAAALALSLTNCMAQIPSPSVKFRPVTKCFRVVVGLQFQCIFYSWNQTAFLGSKHKHNASPLLYPPPLVRISFCWYAV